jgi:hypothetical protein
MPGDYGGSGGRRTAGRSSEAGSRLRRGAAPGLAEATRWIVATAVVREHRLLELDRDFYRRFNRQFVLGYRVGQPLIEGIRRMLEGKRDELRVENPNYASFLMARGLGAILRVAVEERPECLADPEFVHELVDLFLRLPGARFSQMRRGVGRVTGPERLRTARVWAVGAAPEEVPRTAHRRRVTLGSSRFAR